MDYAEFILDKVNYTKFTEFVYKAETLEKGMVIYFYGTGNNGKTTLTQKMIDCYPCIFSRGSEGCVIICEETCGELIDPEKNYIIVTNILPHGVHHSKIIHFQHVWS